jgi:CheY-like chemotaxis protein
VAEALTELGGATPDIILTDLALPQQSGLQLIQHVRSAKGDLQGLPIIVLSACAFQADRDAALGAGASTFIPKPFRPSEILRLVRDLTLQRALTPQGLPTEHSKSSAIE